MEQLIFLDNELGTVGSALQIYLEKQPLLVVGSVSRKHKELLACFLKKLGKEDTEYQLTGAGYANIRDKDRIVLYGGSVEHRLHPDTMHAQDITKLLNGRVVEVRLQ